MNCKHKVIGIKMDYDSIDEVYCLKCGKPLKWEYAASIEEWNKKRRKKCSTK